MINGFTLHETATAPEASVEILNGIQKGWGFVPNLHRILAESPAALEAYSTLWGIAEKTGFTPQERNIVYLAIIYENECTYCMAGHTNLSRMAKVDNAANTRPPDVGQQNANNNLIETDQRPPIHHLSSRKPPLASFSQTIAL